jgi:hypothetical protein
LDDGSLRQSVLNFSRNNSVSDGIPGVEIDFLQLKMCLG